MNFIEQFATYNVNAWIVGDGVTSRHVSNVKATTNRVFRKGKVAAAALLISAVSIAAASSQSIVSVGNSADTLEPVQIQKDKQESQIGVFEKNALHIISQLQSRNFEQVSPDTLALARVAVNKKDEFAGKNIRQWAESLAGLQKQKNA